MVQVVAARRLFDAGIMVKDGSALERLAEIDSAVFDKTGTLTLGDAVLAGASEIEPKALTLAAALAAHSRHPHSRAIAAAAGANPHAPAFETITELAGCGIEAELQGARYRLGRAEWALAPGSRHSEATVLARDGKLVAAFRFSETLRPGAAAAIAELKRQDIAVEIASGDSAAIIAPLAEKLGISTHMAGALPADKLARLEELRVAGHKTLMVGDGINDAAALAGAHVSMAPASAAEIGRNAADFVFLHKDLGAVPQALGVARAAARLVKQNFAIAIFYNVVAIPLAVLGLVTPFIAAIAMSASSLVVVANALRLGRGRKNREHEPLQEPVVAEAAP
jgi:Cu2+-exporting ATPase